LLENPLDNMGKPEIIKATHRNKCESCDELATIKFKEEKGDLYTYMCGFCFKDTQKNKKS